MTSVPQERKIREMAFSKPVPKASRMTTVAMPQAMPSMVRAVRRRLCCIAPKASFTRSRVMFILLFLFLAQGLDGFEHGGLAGGIETGRDAGQSQRKHRADGGQRDDARSVEALGKIYAGEETDEKHGSADSKRAAEQGQECALEEELEEDRAVGCAEGFAQSDFAGALGHGHQHDVNDADRAQG